MLDMNGIDQRAAKFLVSVMSAPEARLAIDAGADIVDAKDAATGALGALPLHVTRAIVAVAAGQRPVSATIGDCALADAPSRVHAAAAAGADFVKVGLFGAFGGGGLDALKRCAQAETKLIAVLFADRSPDLGLVGTIAEAGFYGVMLDTARKSGGGLRQWMGDRAIADFLGMARKHGLMAGLAGSLRHADIPPLLALRPDVMGFRGALCQDGRRSATLSPHRLGEIRTLLHSPQSTRPIKIDAASAMQAPGG